jgi:hypothetical protein
MCIVCNPFCGHCRPPRKRAVTCPDCGADNRYDIVISDPPTRYFCSGCGADLTLQATPAVVYCLNTNRECANPCHWHTVPHNPAVKRTCRQNTPPPLRAAAHTKTG